MMRGAIAAALLLASTVAQADGALTAVKAAFVFNFIKLVSWPDARVPAPSTPLRVCVLRGDTMEDALRQALANKAVGTHPLEITPVGTDEDYAACHVLYLGPQGSPRYSALMARAAGKGVLVVDEGPQFSWPDGMIRLFLEQNRVRFELNLESFERSGLVVDPRLVRLARIAPR